MIDLAKHIEAQPKKHNAYKKKRVLPFVIKTSNRNMTTMKKVRMPNSFVSTSFIRNISIIFNFSNIAFWYQDII